MISHKQVRRWNLLAALMYKRFGVPSHVWVLVLQATPDVARQPDVKFGEEIRPVIKIDPFENGDGKNASIPYEGPDFYGRKYWNWSIPKLQWAWGGFEEYDS